MKKYPWRCEIMFEDDSEKNWVFHSESLQGLLTFVERRRRAYFSEDYRMIFNGFFLDLDEYDKVDTKSGLLSFTMKKRTKTIDLDLEEDQDLIRSMFLKGDHNG